jgi:hypothetical protein
MAAIRCPHCGKNNPSKLDICKYCGSELRQSIRIGDEDSQSVPATESGQDVDLTNDSEENTPQGVGENEEQTAPPFRKKPVLVGKKGEGKNIKSGIKESENPQISSNPAVNELAGEIPSDLLAGFEKLTTDEEETPDWINGLSEVKTGRKSSEPTREKETPAQKNPATESPSPPEKGSAPDWVKSLETSLKPTDLSAAEPGSGERLPDWLKVSPDFVKKGKTVSSTGEESKPLGEVPEGTMVKQPQEPDKEAPSREKIAGAGSIEESIPSEKTPGEETPLPSSPGEPALDWIDSLKKETTSPNSPAIGISPESLPGWMSDLNSGPGTPTSSTGESVPDWLSDLESKPDAESGKTSAFFNTESLAAQLNEGEMPDWLEKMQADANVDFIDEQNGKGENESIITAPGAPLEEIRGSLEKDQKEKAIPPDDRALVEKNRPSSGEQAFSIEMPDWLSQLKPDHAEEPSSQPGTESTGSGETTTSNLPSWVQAMRPVETVVSGISDQGIDKTHAEVKNGPLAGLSGVLPVEPGLGLLKKPPAYSVKLQLSEAQQKYAAFLEQMVAGESQPRKVESHQGKTNQVLRWMISGLLLLTLGIPLLTGAQITPVPSGLSSDNNGAKIIIDGIPAQSPVLIAFDYDPSLSAEMAAVAAPLVDQLQQKGTRLTLISTSPAGPALAERFMHTTPLVNTSLYQAGVDYVNLGYLAGGLSGIYAFAADPQKAAPYDVSGKPVWGLGPLQGVQSMQDFKVVLVITDNGDSARNWVEQAGGYMGDTPLIMITSAQAGPLVRPYFESGQVKGMLAGLTDARIYEQEYNRPGLAANSWSSYTLGLVVAEAMIGIGALVNLILNIQRRGKGKGEEV